MVNIPFCNQRATMAVIRWQPEPAILEQTELVHSHMHYFLLAGPPPPNKHGTQLGAVAWAA